MLNSVDITSKSIHTNALSRNISCHKTRTNREKKMVDVCTLFIIPRGMYSLFIAKGTNEVHQL